MSVVEAVSHPVNRIVGICEGRKKAAADADIGRPIAGHQQCIEAGVAAHYVGAAIGHRYGASIVVRHVRAIRYRRREREVVVIGTARNQDRSAPVDRNMGAGGTRSKGLRKERAAVPGNRSAPRDRDAEPRIIVHVRAIVNHIARVDALH